MKENYVEVLQADMVKDGESIRSIFWEYLSWANERLKQEFGISFDIATMLEEGMAELENFMPPHGRLLLARHATEVVGCACLRTIGEGIAEVKRMYVRPTARGRGAGSALLNALIQEAHQAGYRVVRLDSARFMHQAHSLYRAAGFTDTEPYPGSEVPEAFQGHWLFMEKRLAS